MQRVFYSFNLFDFQDKVFNKVGKKLSLPLIYIIDNISLVEEIRNVSMQH